MLWIKSGIENPLKSEVIGRCGGDIWIGLPFYQSVCKMVSVPEFYIRYYDIKTAL